MKKSICVASAKTKLSSYLLNAIDLGNMYN